MIQAGSRVLYANPRSENGRGTVIAPYRSSGIYASSWLVLWDGSSFEDGLCDHATHMLIEILDDSPGRLPVGYLEMFL